MSPWLRGLLAIGLALATASSAGGQLGPQATIPLQFSFSDPGARSLGFGGAFVALADDATAAFSNPAGLVQLSLPELSLEGRQWSYSTPFTAGGRWEGEPSGFGIDTVSGLRFETSEEEITGLSFLSYVYTQRRWSLALYRHQLARFDFFSETQGLFSGGTDCCQRRELDQRSTWNLEIATYGLAWGYQVRRPPASRRVPDQVPYTLARSAPLAARLGFCW